MVAGLCELMMVQEGKIWGKAVVHIGKNEGWMGHFKGVVECGKCTNTHYFFFVDLTDLPPSPSYYMRYVFLSSNVFLNVFLFYGPGFLKIL